MPRGPESIGQIAEGNRVRGGIEVTLAADSCRTFARRVREADGYRLLFPDGERGCEAVVLNTGGGVAGGDHVGLRVDMDAGADATLSTVSAEKIYRAPGEPTVIEVAIDMGDGARLAFLPQETILHGGARLRRTIQAEVAQTACLTIADVVVFGRRGSGDLMSRGEFTDTWRLRRAGRLVHMEAARLSGSIAERLARAACAGGGHVVATLVHLADDAGDRIETLRARLVEFEGVPGLTVAASAWDGKLVVRALSDRSDKAKSAIAAAARHLTGRKIPRVWGIDDV